MGRKKKKKPKFHLEVSLLSREDSPFLTPRTLKEKKHVNEFAHYISRNYNYISCLPFSSLFFFLFSFFVSYEICLLLELDIWPKQKRRAEGKIQVSQWLWKWHQQRIWRYKLVYKGRVHMLPELDQIVWSNHIKWKYMWRLWFWVKVKILCELFSKHRSHHRSFS